MLTCVVIALWAAIKQDELLHMRATATESSSLESVLFQVLLWENVGWEGEKWGCSPLNFLFVCVDYPLPCSPPPVLNVHAEDLSYLHFLFLSTVFPLLACCCQRPVEAVGGNQNSNSSEEISSAALTGTRCGMRRR